MQRLPAHAHYSVPENIDLAWRSWPAFERFAQHVGDDEASAGLVRCGYLIAASDRPMVGSLRATLDRQRAAVAAPQSVVETSTPRLTA